MIVIYSKYSKRSTAALIVTFIVIGLMFFIETGCAREEKSEQQTIPPVNVDKSKIILDITKTGEILIQDEKIDLNSIQSRIKDFMNEYPDGDIIILSDKDPFNNKVVEEVLDQVRAAKVKNIVVATEKK
ncbi:ExbD/TolR family protein [Thermodesulfobacteriota bacterium]